MIEEINKLQDTIDKGRSLGTIDDNIGKQLLKLSIEILDIYNNQPDYKSAWNELKESQSTNCAYVNLGEELEIRFEELEQKYKLGGE